MKLTKGQKAAVAAAVAGRNVFLTGEGGTGKSVAVEAIVEALKGKAVVLCAPTGVAAVNIDGVTIHKAFNFNTAPKVADELERVKPSKIIHAADCVIIDEVGMVRRDTMDAIGRVVRMENEARKETRRKPLQIIVVGDFFQLPPVAGDDEPALIEAYGPTSTGSSFFAFESDAWGMLDFQICMLDEVMRQKGDAAFVDALNQARLGDVACLPFFNGLTTAQKGEPPAEAVSVVPSKKKAREINRERLASLGTPLTTFHGVTSDSFADKDKQAPQELQLGIGARVICLKNDSDAGYVNGSTGVVTGIVAPPGGEVDADNPHIAVTVQLDGRADSVIITANEWEKIGYQVVRGRLIQERLGSYTQIPLAPAYAITYHKSQGQTLDAASIDPSTFAAGMLYVGLSRVRSAAGLWLAHPIKEEDLQADPAAVAFYERGCRWEPASTVVSYSENSSTTAEVSAEIEEPRPEQPQAQPPTSKLEKDTAVVSYSKNIEEIQEELHDLLGAGGRAWVRVYELISLVRAEKLYTPEYRSFSAWLNAEAAREGVSTSLLWHRKSAGDFYSAWAAENPSAPPLSECEGFGEDSLELVRKIAQKAPERADELMRDGLDNKGLSTKALRREWRELRAAKKPATASTSECPRAKVSRRDLTITCADGETLDAVIEALRAAGVIFEQS